MADQHMPVPEHSLMLMHTSSNRTLTFTQPYQCGAAAGNIRLLVTQKAACSTKHKPICKPNEEDETAVRSVCVHACMSGGVDAGVPLQPYGVE